MTANLVNCWLTKPVTVERLLSEKPQRAAATATALPQHLNSRIADTSGDPIWQQMEDASRRAAEQRRQREQQAAATAQKL